MTGHDDMEDNEKVQDLLALREHPCPAGPPCDDGPLPAVWWAAVASPELGRFRAAIEVPGRSLTDSVLEEVATFFDYPRWRRRFDPAGAGGRELFDRHRRRGLDLLWQAMLEATGDRFPAGVAIARSVGRPASGARHLDFGSGAGVTSQLFAAQGFEVELADAERVLLEFARFRLERRGLRARYIELQDGLDLGSARYDFVTAIDSLQQLPDAVATARALHRALKPGGLLFANADRGPQTAGRDGRAVQPGDEVSFRRLLQRCGFEPEGQLGRCHRFRRVEPQGLVHAIRGIRDGLVLNGGFVRACRRARSLLGR